jgi:hypothetical protein
MLSLLLSASSVRAFAPLVVSKRACAASSSSLRSSDDDFADFSSKVRRLQYSTLPYRTSSGRLLNYIPCHMLVCSDNLP